MQASSFHHAAKVCLLAYWYCTRTPLIFLHYKHTAVVSMGSTLFFINEMMLDTL